jgi:dUTP pyrophosphatase
MSLQIQKLVPEAYLPSLPSPGAAGYDLYAYTECVVEPGRRLVVPLGFTVQIPEGLYGRLAARTGLSVKHGLGVLGGVVDPDYQGEVKVILYNTDRHPFVIHPGYRIAQLILERYETPDIHEIETIDLTADEEPENQYHVCGV